MPSQLKKIRDIERLLRRINSSQDKADGELPTTAKVSEPNNGELKLSREETRNMNKMQGKLEELEELKNIRLENLRKEKERKNSVKYHLVRFLERKKVTRWICSIEASMNEFDSSSDQDDRKIKALQQRKLELEQDLTYIMYFPMEHKYISLFAKSNRKEQKSNENSDSEESTASKDGKEVETTLYSAQRHSPAVLRLKELAEAARQRDRDGGYLPEREITEEALPEVEDTAQEPPKDKVEHAIQVAKQHRKTRRTGRLVAEQPQKEKERVQGVSEVEEEGGGEKVAKEGKGGRTAKNPTIDTTPLMKPLSTTTVREDTKPTNKKDKKKRSDPATTSTAKNANTNSTSTSTSSKVDNNSSAASGDAFFVEETDPSVPVERAAELDQLHIGDMKGLNRKKYKHRNLFKKRRLDS